jgi:hypothetical protein
MPYENLTYETADQVAKQFSLGKYKNVLHITATNSLRRGVIQNNSELRWIEAPILTFGKILERVGYQWFSGKVQLKQYTAISSFLREYSEENKPSLNPSIFNALDKNKDIMLRTIRTFEEADVTNHDIKDALKSPSYEEKLCLDLWQHLEETSSIQNYRRWFQNFEENADSMFREMVENILVEAYQNDIERNMANLTPRSFDSVDELKVFVGNCTNELLKDKAIIFHGFYFITPIQQRIIRALEKAGYTIIQLINYRKGYSSVFEVVESFLDFESYPPYPLDGLPPIINQVSNKFLGTCEGEFNHTEFYSASKYYSFQHLYQFKRFIESDSQNNDFLISPRAQEVRNHIEDTSNLANLQLKDYPIGQFFINIHQINTSLFNEQTKSFHDQDQLNTTILKRIFSSGYLYVDGESSKNYINDLEKISERLEFTFTFNDFESKKLTLDAWISALEKLIDDKAAIEDALTPDIEEISIDEALYLYPNRFLSYFSVPLERLHVILKGFVQIKNLYNMIFTGENIQLKNYLDDLKFFVNKEILPHVVQEDEKKIAIKLLEKFESLKDDEIESFDRRDLIQGLRYFLSENVEDENSNSLFGESLLEGRIVSLQDGDFLPFVDNQHVHLAFIDNKSLPLMQNIVTWPFNTNSMNLLYEKHKDLYLIKKRKNLDASITKYLIYLITQNASSIKFSSVSNFNQERNLRPSFYIDLLNLPRGDIESTIKSSKESSNQQFYSETIQPKKRQKTHLLEMTKSKCTKRMVLSYFLQDYPTYENEFHQRFVFSALLSRFLKIQKKNSNIMTQVEMRKVIFDLFPHWSQSKKEILATKVITYGNSATDYAVDRIVVFDNLENIAFIGTKRLDTPKKFANPGPHCKYCPFQNYCKESVREVDG